MVINYLERSAIDDTLWNKCIGESINGIVYAYTWYLDIVSPSWSALVSDDYTYVFPLPSARRFNIDMLLQPLFTQQLGLFSVNHVTSEVLNEFIQQIPEDYKYINIHLNTINRYLGTTVSEERITYQLDLIQPYTKIQKAFNQNTRRNNLKSIAFGVVVAKIDHSDDFIDFYRTHSKKLNKSKYSQVENLVNILNRRGLCEMIGAFYEGELCAVALIVKSNGKLIYLFASSSSLGLQKRAMFAIVDQIIRWNSESHLVLDFEGSIIPSIARFYAGFGAKPCVYQKIIIDKMHFYTRILFKLKNILSKH